jgi:hypothetical protein
MYLVRRLPKLSFLQALSPITRNVAKQPATHACTPTCKPQSTDWIPPECSHDQCPLGCTCHWVDPRKPRHAPNKALASSSRYDTRTPGNHIQMALSITLELKGKRLTDLGVKTAQLQVIVRFHGTMLIPFNCIHTCKPRCKPYAVTTDTSDTIGNLTPMHLWGKKVKPNTGT